VILEGNLTTTPAMVGPMSAAGSDVDDSPIDHKKLVTRWIAEVWNNRREEAIDEMMAPECLAELEGVDHPVTPADFKAYRRAFLEAVPDLMVEIFSIVTEGETSTLHWRVTGTHLGHGLGIPPSGRRVAFTGTTFYRFKGSLIVGGFDTWNRGEVIASLMQVRIEELCERVLLTRREAQVALMMAERFPHTEIATQLGIKPNTARRHCERVLKKLGVRRRQDVATALGKIPGSVLNRHGADLAEAS
jgi:DNA-binding CsgD family transcriptional regulator/predicted ester cyclase